jgi:histidyl-tRNA synthetase
MPPPDQKKRMFQAPKGTRDFYPPEMLRRRFIEKAWRDVSIRHGFDEIDGPTFEHTDLYTVKSGEAILGEVFNVFSGKDEEQVREASGGQAPFALRPEFTPTLARMYAARAAQLPRPTKWFWQQNCFRAERPQRGRLREFLQWNCDLIGDNSPTADSEIVACCVGLLESLGLKPADVRVRLNHRRVLSELLTRLGVDEEHMASAYILLDRREKLSDDDLEAMAFEFGLTGGDFVSFLKRPRGRASLKELLEWVPGGSSAANLDLTAMLRATEDALREDGIDQWCEIDFNIVRGLAYYTGMVFEVHEASGAERAIAGGGRYDNLIELFGGPPTPAVGFGMGDVVLSLVLHDRGLFPDGKDLMERLSACQASLRPDVFVIPNEKEESQAAMRPLVATLRRAGLHARHSYKATKNIGKLLGDAKDAGSRFAAIIETGAEVTLKSLDDGAQERLAPGEIVDRVQRS